MKAREEQEPRNQVKEHEIKQKKIVKDKKSKKKSIKSQIFFFSLSLFKNRSFHLNGK